MSLLFNTLSRLVIVFLSSSNCLLISCLQSLSAMILEPKKIKSVTTSIVTPSICHEVMGPDAMIIVFWMLSFKPTFSLSSFTFIKRLFSSSSLSVIWVVSSAYLRLLIFLLAILIPACASSSPGFSWCTQHELFQILKDDVVKVLHWICQQIWKTQQWLQDWKRSVFIPIPKKGNAKLC